MEISGTVESVGVTPRTRTRPLKDIGLAPATFYAGEIARIDRLIAENIDEDYPNRERFLTHLRGRREVLAEYMERVRTERGIRD